jgi:hypothetical protein
MKSKKYSCGNSGCSQRGVTWQTDSIGLRKFGLGLPSHLLSPKQLNSNSPGTFLYHFVTFAALANRG